MLVFGYGLMYLEGMRYKSWEVGNDRTRLAWKEKS